MIVEELAARLEACLAAHGGLSRTDWVALMTTPVARFRRDGCFLATTFDVEDGRLTLSRRWTKV